MADSQGHDHLYHPTRRRLLRDLTGAGVGAAGLGLLGCEAGGDPTSEGADAATPSCTLTPEGTEGPFHAVAPPTRASCSSTSIYADSGGSGTLLRLRRRKASTIRKGLIGTITIGIDPS